MIPRSTCWASAFCKCIFMWWLGVLALGVGIHVSSGVDSHDHGIQVRTGDEYYPSGAMAHEKSNMGVATGGAHDHGEKQEVSLCLLMIVRDEEASLKMNLPVWLDVADCFVIGVDDRTTDSTSTVVQQALGYDKASEKGRFVFYFTFVDFAQARNAVLRSTAHHFPNASHVIVADADWRPDLATVDKSELDFVHSSFPFLVWDHSGHTCRLMGWLLRFDENLRFKYRIHEVLDASGTVASALQPKLVGWEVRVVESDSNWNANLHKHSRSSERFKFDLALLQLDYEDDPTDLHTLFYLGITTFAYIESLIGKGTHKKTPELLALITSGMSYLRKAVDLHGQLQNSELVWGSKRWLAYGYHYFIGDSEEAKGMYEACIEYDPARVDCVIFLSRLYLDTGDLDAAWDKAKVALLHRPPVRRVMTYFYVFECFVSAQVWSALGYLVRHFRDQCAHGVMVDLPEDIDRLESWFEETIARERMDVTELKQLTLLNDDEGSLLALLLRTWGTGTKASSARYQQQQQQQLSTAGEISDVTAEELAQQRSFDVSETQHQADEPTSGTLERPLESTARDWLGRVTDTSGWASFTAEDCGRKVDEARMRLELGEQELPGLLAAISVTQTNGVMASSPQDNPKHFRALVFGGGGIGGGRTGLEHEELSRLLVLLLQLSSTSSEVTFAHPDSLIVEAVRSVASGCANELGIAPGGHIRLNFWRSTLADFLSTTATPDIDQFDYVDIGGPLAWSGGGRKDSATAVLHPQTLTLLGHKLSPGACLRAWAFAKNPSTELAFRIAAATKKDPRNGDRQAAEYPPTSDEVRRVITRRTGDSLLENILRTTFQVGQKEALVAESVPTSDALDTVAGKGTDEEVAGWMRQVLAGGDRLSIPDIDQILAESGFELALMLGQNTTERGEVTTARATLRGIEEELLEEGLSRWEIADFVASLELAPTLVHQVFAVWRGGGSSVALS